MNISPAEMEIYRQTARRRDREEQDRLERRFERAHAAARKAATMLMDEFGAREVVMFGSLVHPDLFHSRSDIDLAAWGVDEFDYYRAVGRLQSVAPEFSIDLVRMEEASGSLRKRILREGVAL